MTVMSCFADFSCAKFFKLLECLHARSIFKFHRMVRNDRDPLRIRTHAFSRDPLPGKNFLHRELIRRDRARHRQRIQKESVDQRDVLLHLGSPNRACLVQSVSLAFLKAPERAFLFRAYGDSYLGPINHAMPLHVLLVVIFLSLEDHYFPLLILN